MWSASGVTAVGDFCASTGRLKAVITQVSVLMNLVTEEQDKISCEMLLWLLPGVSMQENSFFLLCYYSVTTGEEQNRQIYFAVLHCSDCRPF